MRKRGLAYIERGLRRGIAAAKIFFEKNPILGLTEAGKWLYYI